MLDFPGELSNFWNRKVRDYFALVQVISTSFLFAKNYSWSIKILLFSIRFDWITGELNNKITWIDLGSPRDSYRFHIAISSIDHS